MNKLPLIILASILSVPSLAHAVCLSMDKKDSKCRYPAGDEWCKENGKGNKYAYSDDCLKKPEEEQISPRITSNQSNAQRNIPQLRSTQLDLTIEKVAKTCLVAHTDSASQAAAFYGRENCAYATDQSLTVRARIHNSGSYSVKDVKVNCKMIAKSGTVLRTHSHTIYDVWHSNDTKRVEFQVPSHEQVTNVSCNANP